MRLILVAPPRELPVTLAQAKVQCRVDSDEDDLLIQGYLDAAVSHLDGYHGVLGRCLVTQTWRADVTAVGERLQLPFPDCTVTAVVHTDLLAGDLAWRWHESLAHPAIVPLGGWGRPASVTFTAGFGPAQAVPHALKQAILLLVARWYDDRAVGAIPDGFDDLVFPFRVRRL